MEQITRRDGLVYYGERRCINIEDAYGLFRKDYHESIGRDSYARLDRLGRRKERVHGFGFVFEREPSKVSVRGKDCPVIRARMLGIVCISYCRMVGEGLPDLEDEEFDRWFDWTFRAHGGCVRTVGRNSGNGRTSKRKNVRYK